MGFEYMTSVLSHGFMGRHKGELKRAELEAALNERGRDGWELVHVWFDQGLSGREGRPPSDLPALGLEPDAALPQPSRSTPELAKASVRHHR
jgi:hypothetical protein